ncbi:MAG: amidohydrolase [Chloroflexi bacterium]|nr:amidohydrolase [Chloroflexota bacterium]
MIIDFHTHILPPSFNSRRSHYIERDATLAALFSDPRARMATAEELVAAPDEAGVDMAVALGMGWTNREVAQEANDYLLESAARHPKRILPFCSVNPAWGEPALVEAQRCARLGARGIGELHPDTQGYCLTEARVMAPLMELAHSLKLVVLTHASEPLGHAYPGKGSVTPALLMEFIHRYPDVPIVCAHWGGGLPFYALMPEVRRTLANAYVDTAASPLLYRKEVFSLAPRLVGAGHILFGSDSPLLTPARLLRQARSSSLSDAEKQAVLGGNAQRLLRLPDTPNKVMKKGGFKGTKPRSLP